MNKQLKKREFTSGFLFFAFTKDAHVCLVRSTIVTKKKPLKPKGCLHESFYLTHCRKAATVLIFSIGAFDVLQNFATFLWLCCRFFTVRLSYTVYRHFKHIEILHSCINFTLNLPFDLN